MTKVSRAELDRTVLFAVVASDFDLDKAAKRLEGFGVKRRMVEVLASWEAHIADLENLEITTHDPQTRLLCRRLLAIIRETRHPSPNARTNEAGR